MPKNTFKSINSHDEHSSDSQDSVFIQKQHSATIQNADIKIFSNNNSEISNKSKSETIVRAHSSTGPSTNNTHISAAAPRKQSLPQISTPISRPRRQTSAVPMLLGHKSTNSNTATNVYYNKQRSFTQLLSRGL